MNVKLLTDHHLEFLSLKGGCTGSSVSTLVKMPYGVSTGTFLGEYGVPMLQIDFSGKMR